MRAVISMVLVALCISSAVSADYEYIDTGDYYYINRFGDNNEHVVVVRKMGNDKVKVRDLSDGSTQIVSAYKLLTKSELDNEETKNAVGGVALGLGLLYCLANPDECKQ